MLQAPNATSETVNPPSCNRNTYSSHVHGYCTTPFTINLGIRAVQGKIFRQIHDEIRVAQARGNERLGGLSGLTWVARVVPSSLFRIFIRMAARSARMAMRYGVISVTAVGMFGLLDRPVWLVLLSASTVAVTVGGIVTSWGAEGLGAGPFPAAIWAFDAARVSVSHPLFRPRHYRWRAGSSIHETAYGVAGEWSSSSSAWTASSTHRNMIREELDGWLK